MIIRSQNKKELHNLDTIKMIRAVTDSQRHYIEVNSQHTIGTYSTEEKTIKVLDMIRNFHAATELLKLGKNIANSSAVSEFEDMFFECFDMPADEDVEV